jgi:hypothetical protein
MPTLVMPALMPYAAPVREGDSALVRVLEAYIETLRAENEILGRRLAAAEARGAQRERCPWWCRRLGSPDDRATGAPIGVKARPPHINTFPPRLTSPTLRNLGRNT